MLRLAFVLSAGAAVALSAQSAQLPHTSPASVGIDPVRLEAATALLGQFIAERKIAGAVAAVARRGRVAYLHAAGFQNVESRTPMTERSLFRIYSMTKAVTAVAAMILHEEGRFQLHDPVSKYLPEFRQARVLDVVTGMSRPPAREVTVADLLLHTSGLSHRTSAMYRTEKVRSRSESLPRFVSNIVRAPLMEDPGTAYRYSEGTTVVGRLIEIWSGTPLDVFMKARVFDPLGMVDTGFWTRPDQQGRLATVYSSQVGRTLEATEIEEVPFTERPALLEGAVGLVSTVPDFLRFSQMLLNRGELGGTRVLSPETVGRITSNGLPAPILQDRGGGMGWGLANVNVVVDPDALPDSPNLGEYGWDGSAGTVFWIDPKANTIILLMTQNLPANPDSLRLRFKRLVRAAIEP